MYRPGQPESDEIKRLARAILYEGYLLYPYRVSSLKNRQRWNFGVLFPPGFSEFEASFMQTECLLEGSPNTVLSAQAQFLQYDADSAVEREIPVGGYPLRDLIGRPAEVPFSFPHLSGMVTISATHVQPDGFKVTIRIFNQTSFTGSDREEALRHALLSTQTLLHVQHGAFYSLIDPPPSLVDAKERCHNIGAWPVLVGRPGQRDFMLSLPIILYDYPQLAPQSPADLFDNTEIDEILTLRIQTLTDEEKLEARLADPRARDLLAHAESLPSQTLRNLHGTFRSHPTGLRRGDRVRLKPNRKADIFDIALAGRLATVSSIEQDFEDRLYACVVLDDDPGRDFGAEGKPGHRFFFSLDELEKL